MSHDHSHDSCARCLWKSEFDVHVGVFLSDFGECFSRVRGFVESRGHNLENLFAVSDHEPSFNQTGHLNYDSRGESESCGLGQWLADEIGGWAIIAIDVDFI